MSISTGRSRLGNILKFRNTANAVPDGVVVVEAELGRQLLKRPQLLRSESDMHAFHGHSRSIPAQLCPQVGHKSPINVTFTAQK
jgi:hypothetical protein